MTSGVLRSRSFTLIFHLLSPLNPNINNFRVINYGFSNIFTILEAPNAQKKEIGMAGCV